MKKYLFKPQGNCIAAQLIEEKDKVSAGGIYIPDQAKDKPMMAKVLSVGPGLENYLTGKVSPVPLKAGDIVVINKFSYQNFEMPDGSKIALFTYGDVLGVLEDLGDATE